MYRIFFKRAIDIVFCFIGIIPLFVVIIIIAPIIYLSDKGPIFYNASRLGRNGKVFIMRKFRSMKVNALDIRNNDGTTFNSEDDPRVTKIGKFIRKTSLDELPQLFNILSGDMSLVGPRPDLPDAINLYSEEEKLKLTVRPGITGYNQAYYRNAANLHERFRRDVFYAQNVSFLLDMKILLRTVITVIKRENIYGTTGSREKG